MLQPYISWRHYEEYRACAPQVMTLKSLDAKLARIHADPHGARDFILADAKDADMAMGLLASGSTWDGERERPRSLAEYRELMREVARQELVDILLMSASSHDLLGIQERLFDNSPVTVAVRANDTTDIHLARGGCYPQAPSMPFRSATIEQLQCGHVTCDDEERRRGCNLGLYSVTLNNHPEADLRTLEAYRAFRIEAEQKGFRHFLEVFDPNVLCAIEPERVGDFVNDQIVRLLAAVPRSGRPLFLKIVYHGPKCMEALAAYDPHLVPGVLGGAAGTTHDAFHLLAEARKYGARAALFGRKINRAEHQLTFIQCLRRVADGEINAKEAVSAYHGDLQKLKIRARLPLEQDLELTQTF
jgi:hypothetical protein